MSERFGMVVDVNRCVGCQTCTIACKQTNDTVPGVQWRQVLDIETGSYPDVERLFLVTGCQHCADPPCVPVCPTGATAQRADGLITMDYDMCIGCAACAVACPYQARNLVHDQNWYYGEETSQETAVRHDDRLGVAQKCTFCVEKIDEAKESGKTPGVDLDVTPACAASCIAQAIQFGDFADPGSHVSELVRDNANFQMHEDLGTDPQIRYLYETPTVPGRAPNDHDNSLDSMTDPANPLVGEVQNFWDGRAAMNFIFGGIGAGLAVISFFVYLVPGLPEYILPQLYAASAIIIAFGLFFVFLKIGRKKRFLYVLLRPQSSWMSREVYAVGVFYALVAAEFVWPSFVLHGLVPLAAIIFLFCQAKILQVSKGIPAWRVSRMTGMLLLSGLAEGLGLLALAFGAYKVPVGAVNFMAILGAGLAAVNGETWILYRREAEKKGIGPLACQVIEGISRRLHIFGHGIPFFLFLTVAGGIGGTSTLAVAGAGMIAGGIYWKYIVIVRASHQQGFALAKFPQRGSGRLSAPFVVNTKIKSPKS